MPGGFDCGVRFKKKKNVPELIFGVVTDERQAEDGSSVLKLSLLCSFLKL